MRKDRMRALSLKTELYDGYDVLGSQTAKIGDSANGVVVVQDKDDPTQKFAAKSGAMGKLTHELAMQKSFIELMGGELALPLGEIVNISQARDGDEYGLFITKYLPDLQPFSRQDLPNPRLGNFRATRISQFAKILGRLHSTGFSPGDFQAKNVGNRANGKPIVFDFEASELFDPTVAKEYESAAKQDLLSFRKSLAIKQLFGVPAVILADDMVDFFDTPYLEATLGHGVVPENRVYSVLDNIAESFAGWAENGGDKRARLRFMGPEAR